MCNDHEPLSNDISTLSLPPTASLPFSPIPPGSTSVDVSVLDGGSIDVPLSKMVLNTDGQVEIPVFAFLVENKRTGRALVFDLGIKTAPSTYPPEIIKRFTVFHPKPPPVSIGRQLQEGGYDLTKVDTVVYSHNHWDHTGDISDFPPGVALKVGPGSLTLALPGYPFDPLAHTSASDFPHESRTVREFPEAAFDIRVGPFRALDYWNDGSVYLLDTPGHLPGHLGALVRTTVSPPSFLLLAGDAAGHRCLFSNFYEMPWRCGLWPGPTVVDNEGKESTPLMAMHRDLKTAYETIAGLRRMDQEEDCMVIIAHDISFQRILEQEKGWWPQRLNEWQKRGWKEAVNCSLADP